MERRGDPRWTCQNCRHPIHITGADGHLERIASSGMPSGSGSLMNASRMDLSYVMLAPKQKNPGYPPPRPRNAGVHFQKDFGKVATESHRAMDGSFVFLPSAASIFRNEPSNEAHTSGGALPGGSNPQQQHTSNASFNTNVNVLTKISDIAASQTQVDYPLCIDCSQRLAEEQENELEDLNMDIKAFKACIERLEQEQQNALSEEDFAAEMAKILEEEKQLEAEIEKVNKENLTLKMQLEVLDSKSKTFETLEESYWHDVNDFTFKLHTQQDEAEAVQAKIEVVQAQLNMLTKTNVLSDAFNISREGEFGIINNFRLCFSNSQVEWDEINAAWGQACLLLYTMGRYCHVKFSYRIIPMGSYPSIADSKNTYELYGPVNVFWSTKYDKAKQYFLTCLKEFADFAANKDRAGKVENVFQLPYKIEGDKVAGIPITRTFNQQENNALVLKYTLCDLKWALYWLVANTSFQPASSISTMNHGSASSSSTGSSPSSSSQRF